MGNPTGGLFGLASDAVSQPSPPPPDNPNAADTGSGVGSFDPSSGMGGVDPSMGAGADVAAPGVDPGIASVFGQAGGGGGFDPTGSVTAQQQIASGSNLGAPGQPPTDQPVSGGQQQGPQRYASAGRPDVTPQEAGYQGLGPRTNLGALTATPGQPPAPDIAHAFAGSGPDAPGIHWDPIEGNPQYIRQGPSVTVSPEESQTGQHGVDEAPPKPAAYAPPATQEGTKGGDLTTDTKGNKIPGGVPITTAAAPPTTPPATAAGGGAGGGTAAPGAGGGTVTDPQGAGGPATETGQQGQQAGMGRMPQSPLEQLIGQLLQPLEHMIARALGINPNALFHAFQGGNLFNRQAGPGYYPPGATGGRTVQGGPPSLTPPPAQSGGQSQSPPQTPPGAPGSPGNQPSATPLGRREGGFDPTLPGYPYTGETRDQPPPWYQPEGTRSPEAQAAGAGAGGIAGVPGQVAQLARQYAMKGGPGAVFQFMHDNGYPKSGPWCGEFAAAVMRSQGLPVPRDNPAVASNWRTWGNPTNNPQPGDIAVARRGKTGQPGSHVTTVASFDPVRRTVTLTGGNQSGHALNTTRPLPVSGWDFRTMRSPADQIRSIRYQPQMGM